MEEGDPGTRKVTALPRQRKQVDFLSACRRYPCLFAIFMSVQINATSFTVVCTKKLPLQRRFTPADCAVWEPPSSHYITKLEPCAHWAISKHQQRGTFIAPTSLSGHSSRLQQKLNV